MPLRGASKSSSKNNPATVSCEKKARSCAPSEVDSLKKGFVDGADFEPASSALSFSEDTYTPLLDSLLVEIASVQTMQNP